MEEIAIKISKILNKKIKFKLLYKASKDGDAASTFHEKCDNIENTLILIHASGKKRFGGFTTQTWDGNNVNKKDKNSFIFSIDKNKIYDIKNDQFAIGCYPEFGPIFMGCQIRLLDHFFTQGGTTFYKDVIFKTTEDFELTGGAQKFGVIDLEVYEVKSI